MSEITEQKKLTRKYVKKSNITYGRPRLNKSPDDVKKGLRAIAMKSYYKKQGLTTEVARSQKKAKALIRADKKETLRKLKETYKKIIELDVKKINSIIRAINSVIE